MTATKRFVSILTVLMTLFVCCFGNCIGASAATCGSSKSTATMYVTTKSNYWKPGASSVTFKQTKGTYSYKKVLWSSKTTTKTGYAIFDIKAVPVSGNGKTKTAKLSGSSVTLKLDKDTKYKITVTYNSTSTDLRYNFRNSWSKIPTWKVSNYWKVSSIR